MSKIDFLPASHNFSRTPQQVHDALKSYKCAIFCIYSALSELAEGKIKTEDINSAATLLPTMTDLVLLSWPHKAFGIFFNDNEIGVSLHRIKPVIDALHTLPDYPGAVRERLKRAQDLISEKDFPLEEINGLLIELNQEPLQSNDHNVKPEARPEVETEPA